MDKSKNLEQKINLNNDNYNNQQVKMFENESQYEKEVINEIIIELKVSEEEIEKEIYILCDKNKLIEDNKLKKNLMKIILILQKNLIILIKIILNYI